MHRGRVIGVAAALAAALVLAGLSPRAVAQEAGAQVAGAQEAGAQSVTAPGMVAVAPPAGPGAAPDAERPPKIATAAFADRNAFQSARLSPDGKRFAALVEVSGETRLVVFDADTFEPKLAIVTGSEDFEFEWFRWAGSDKVIFSVSTPGTFFGEDVRTTRLIARDLITGETFPVGRRQPVVIGDDVVFVADDGSYVLLSVQKDIYSFPSVIRFNLVPGDKGKDVQTPVADVWQWYADDLGTVRLGVGKAGSTTKIYYRKDEGSKLALIGKFKPDDDDSKLWDIAQIVSGSDIGYVLDENDAGRIGLRRFNYATREVLDTVYENPDWDLDDVSFDRAGQPFAAYYADDQNRVHWFDPQLAKWQAQLERTLPGQQLWIVSRARDNSRLLVWSGSGGDPGALFVFTPAAHQLDQFAEYRPSLDFRQLAEPKPVQYTARDGTVIHAYLTLPRGRAAKALPLILLPHGGPYGIRDKLDYDDEVQLLANRGYAVLQPNYRGSGGYGNTFEKLGDGQIGRKMQDDLDDAMDWMVAQGIADPARVCVVGSSYGGYAALWAVLRNPERYRCAASFAGVTDWDSQLRYDRNYFSTAKRGRAWRDRVRGDEEGFDLDSVSPYRQAAGLSRPVLLAHGKKDTNVPFSQFTKMRAAGEKSGMLETLVFDKAGHGFPNKEDEQRWYDALEAFLVRHNPPD